MLAQKAKSWLLVSRAQVALLEPADACAVSRALLLTLPVLSLLC